MTNILFLIFREGVYNVTVLASNSISHASESKQLFVLDRKCFPPEISVHGQNITLTTVSRFNICTWPKYNTHYSNLFNKELRNETDLTI